MPELPNRIGRLEVHYAWWIVGAVFLALVAYGGTYYSYGILFKPMSDEFGWSRASVSGARTLQAIVQGTGYIVVGTLIDKYGTKRIIAPLAIVQLVGYGLLFWTRSLWQLYLFYGLLVGLGYGCGLAPLTSLVARWFTKRRGLALGIATSGMGVGTLLMPPFLSYVVSSLSWRVAYVVMGFLLLVAFGAAALVLRRDPAEKGLAPYGDVDYRPAGLDATDASRRRGGSSSDGLALRHAMGSASLWMLLGIFAVQGLSAQLVIVHIVNYATDLGITAGTAALILSLIGAGSAVGRLTMGTLSDRVGPKKSLFACMLIVSASILWLITIRNLSSFYLFATVFGFAYGGTTPQATILCAQMFGLRAVGGITGLVSFAAIVGAGIGPLLAGYIFDASNSYSYAFVVGSVLAACGAVVCVLVRDARVLSLRKADVP